MKTNDELQKDVRAEIKWDSLLRDVHTQIGVTANDGVITLSGVVDSYIRKVAAERAAQRISGVKVVASDIQVSHGDAVLRTDTEIAEAVRNALKWNSAVNEDKIEVKVDNGWITLDGEVQWNYEKTSAQNNIEGLVGVRGITNNIRIKPKAIETKDIRNKIAAAFHRNAALDANAIKMEVTGGRIVLKGTVSSWVEKESAEQIAWSSPGVLAVDNHIEVDSEIFA